MNKILLALNSRTFWTIVVIILMNTIPAIKNAFPSAVWLDTANVILGLIATAFHVNPSQNYTTPPAV